MRAQQLANDTVEAILPLRRQFVSVPVSSLPPGRYRLEVRVHDATTGNTALGIARYERVGKMETEW